MCMYGLLAGLMGSIILGAADWQGIAEHPNPAWARPWISLNGEWQFDFDPDNLGLNENWQEQHTFSRTINVPFAWQSPLSGVGAANYNGVAWYQRDVELPGSSSPLSLIFGAVDWHTTVWVNGRKAAEHTGGYTPFEIRLTDYAQPGETARITLRVEDYNHEDQLTGKQARWYTPTGGIWQTVYIEARPETCLASAHVAPDIDNAIARFNIGLSAPAKANTTLTTAITHPGGEVQKETFVIETGATTSTEAVAVANQQLWTPDTPALYEVELSLQEDGETVDTANTYFGMRKVSRGRYDGLAYEHILLNNKPIYLRGALHQSFNPEGVYTHPTDDFIRQDYELAKSTGLNFLRIHIKTEEPRALYWADKLGVMLMCDVPNWWVKSDDVKERWEITMRQQVARDFNHPSIIAWVNFNETWGIGDGEYDMPWREWTRDMYHLTKQLDPTRLVEDNSPCYYDHVDTDINSWHFYIDDIQKAREHIANVVANTFPGSQFNFAEGWRQGTQPLINSEYGGVSAGSGDRDISWVFIHLTNLLRMYDQIGGYIYTELTDIEWEHNGFANYDRSSKTYNYPAGITLAQLQDADFAVLNVAPYQRVSPGDSVVIPVLLSHWSERDNLELRYSVDGQSVDGRPWSDWVPSSTMEAAGAPFRTTAQAPFAFTAPDATGLLYVVVEVLHEGQRVAANYCVVDVRDGSMWPDTYRATFAVNNFSGTSFGEETKTTPPEHAKFSGFGAGYVEYKVTLPDAPAAQIISSGRLIVELGARANRELVDWPERVKPQDYPQTQERKRSTRVEVSLNGIVLDTVDVETDFADAQGVLSHVQHYHHGSHGRIVDLPLTDAALDAVRKALDGNTDLTLRFETAGDSDGGIAIYGNNMGAWPLDPMLVLDVKD